MRLIDADELKKYWEPDRGRTFQADYFIHTIANAPTVEPKRGEWSKKEVYGKTALYECSACKKEMIELVSREGCHSYCHNCGADMRGEKK